MKISEKLFYQKEGKHSSVIFTHRNCPDGAAAAVIAKAMDSEIHWVPITHQKINDYILKTAEKLSQDTKIYVVDISMDEAPLVKLLEQIKDRNIFLGIYDHHETNGWLKDFVENKVKNNFRNYPLDKLEIIFKMDSCGSKIFYDRFRSDHPELAVFEDFVEVNNDRDLWLLQDPRSDDLARFHDILQDEGYVERFLKNPKVEFDEKEKYLLLYSKINENLNHEKLLRNIQIKVDQENYKYGVIFGGDADASNLLNKAIDRFDLEYAILINLNNKRGSIRGRGNKDCSAYAEAYGGGGHRRASGFQIKFQEPKF